MTSVPQDPTIPQELTSEDEKFGEAMRFFMDQGFAVDEAHDLAHINERLEQWSVDCEFPYSPHRLVQFIEELQYNTKEQCEWCGRWFEPNELWHLTEEEAFRIARDGHKVEVEAIDKVLCDECSSDLIWD